MRTRSERQSLAKTLVERVKVLEKALKLDEVQRRLMELQEQSNAPKFWDDSARAQTVLQELNRLRKLSENHELSRREALEAEEFAALLASDDDPLGDELDIKLDALEPKVRQLEFHRMFQHEADPNNAILNINSGAGGTESQDWAQMLMRMYLRWCDRNAMRANIVDVLPGDGAGIKNATITVEGAYAYGYLKAEGGIHRLVRISPFDANARRHTSFASVFVIPEVGDDIKIDIKDTDLRIDTFRAGGAGGQHVNKTDSAVRMTHLPTGIVVQCQNERSQLKNRALAMKILQSKLYERELQERQKAMEEYHSTKKEIGWGSQIRSYVMQPYQMVKDHRTKVETSNVHAVLDGDITEFIEAYLLAAGEPGGLKKLAETSNDKDDL